MAQSPSLKKERVLPASHFTTRARRVLSFAEVDEKVARCLWVSWKIPVLLCYLTVLFRGFAVYQRVLSLSSTVCKI